MGSGGLAPKVSEVNSTLLETGVEATSVTFLAKDLAAVCLCPENLSEAEFKNNGLSLLEELLRSIVFELSHGPCSLHLLRFRMRVKKKGRENGKCGEQRNE